MAAALIGVSIRRRPGLADQVYEALTSSMVSGKLGPGDRLILDRLAEQLGVSPTPIREALARLIQDGIVEERSIGKLQMIPITPRYVAETFAVRARLEGLAAELAAQRLSDSAVTVLRNDLAATSAALDKDDYGPHIAADAHLHHAICDAAGNAMLSRELQSLQLHTDYIRGYSQRHSGDHIRRSHEEHLVLIDALERRDAAAARTAVERHILSSSDRIAHLIDFRRKSDLQEHIDTLHTLP
jgi:DNA-binding GntR family transcriptional regulator